MAVLHGLDSGVRPLVLLSAAAVLVGAGVVTVLAQAEAEPSGGWSSAELEQTVVRHPKDWQREQDLPSSPGLVLVVRGSTSLPSCPDPLLLLRRQVRSTGSLNDAVELYNRFELSRRPGRVVLDQRDVDLPGAERAVLIVAEFPVPAQQPGAAAPQGAAQDSQRVRTFDLLLLTETGRAEHLYAAGCPADLPERFLEEAVLSMRTS